MDNDADMLASDDAEIIDEAIKRFELCKTYESENEKAALDDLRFLAGGANQWDAKAKFTREADGRPCLTVNTLPTYLHQITNELRQNVPSIRISPAEGSDKKKAEIIQGMVRHIEYSSNADVAYDTAATSAAAGGFGYFRIVSDYCRPDSFDQDLRFKRFRNPFMVHKDPASEEPDGSDAQFYLIDTDMSAVEFKLAYPGAEKTVSAFNQSPGKADWLNGESVRICEYYRIVHTPATLVQLSNGEVGYKDQLLSMPPGVTISQERESTRKKIEWFKLTSLEILERTEIKCDWIPVFPVYGDELDINGEVIYSGIVRNAKDPARAYNFWYTSATEEIAMRNKTPYIGAEGQFEGHEEDWAQANVRSMPTLEYKPVSLEGHLAPAPQRQPMADVPAGVLTMAGHARDNIKATTGLFDSSMGNMGNATSGVQERAQQRQGGVTNYHYYDNEVRSIRHAGRCLVSMIPHYYSAARVVRIMGEDGKIEAAKINQPIPPQDQKINKETGVIDEVLNDITVGQYDVTVSTGPSYSTLRQESADSMIEFGKAWPKLMDIAGDKVVRAMDWPGSEDIADRIEKTIPPELTKKEGEESNEPNMVQTPKGAIPAEQAAQMLQEMDAQIQEMAKALEESKSGIAKANIEAQTAIEKANIDAKSREEVAEINAVNRSDVAELNGLVKMLMAKMQPPPLLASTVAKDVVDNDFSRHDEPVMESRAPAMLNGGTSPGEESFT